jgi:hypothetical protein
MAAGAGALWEISGHTLERIDTASGGVVKRITASNYADATAIAVVGDRIQVGFDDGHVAIVNPASNTVEAALELPGGKPVIGMADGFVLVKGGAVFAVDANGSVTPSRTLSLANSIARASDGVVWGVDADLIVASAGPSGPHYVYFEKEGTIHSLGAHEHASAPLPGLDGIAVAGDTLWITDTHTGDVLVVHVGASTTASGPQLPSRVLQWLRNYNDHSSQRGTSADWVLTTHGNASKITSGVAAGDRTPVYLFDIHGSFVWDHSCPFNSPACVSRGRDEVFTVDPRSLQILDYGIESTTPNLARFGAVGHVPL